MSESLWETALGDWYGPATPLMQRTRAYGPNRRGEIVLRRWLRVLAARSVAAGFAVMGVLVAFHAVGVPPRRPQDSGFGSAVCFVMAAVLWHFSLLRLVLRPGEIVRYGVFRHVVVPCAAVERIRRSSTGRGNTLKLKTYGGQTVALYWFDGSLWDALFDFSKVCEDALRAHVRDGARGHPEDRRAFRWSPNRSSAAAALWAAAVVASAFGIAMLRG
ncbi:MULTISPECIES: hypothetical protein [unclassified Streptomyces]|uniref:hypothetical protein n=1 Tax=unclassified Streptomyces TaxID=2593676 RepID=UPI000F4D9FE2|nr:hypothetical protein [Streptomyces sp. A2-16]QUC55412.1 hypothetical protein IOD14_00605 [Streptomyces sp. A2-16]